MGTLDSDFIFSLGPNCRNAWNLRQRFGIDRAQPFDWWITPARSALAMLDRNFEFHVERADLEISSPHEHNSVYNRKLNILHHHDFRRDYADGAPGVVRSITDEELRQVNEKYRSLFDRFRADFAKSVQPIAVVNGVFSGFESEYKGIATNRELNRPISVAEFGAQAVAQLGEKLRLLVITDGEERFQKHPWGWEIQVPDHGERQHTGEQAWVEPIKVFAKAYDRLRLRRSGTVPPTDQPIPDSVTAAELPADKTRVTRICYLTPNSPLPADRGGRVRSHQLWRALCALGEVKLFVLGDKPPRREREMLFAAGARLLPRRLLKMSRFGRTGQFVEAIDPPGLWEAGGQLAAWGRDERFWHGLTRGDAFHRHHLNEKRIARILAQVRAFGADVVVIDDTSLSPLIPIFKAAGLKVAASPENLDSQLWFDIAQNAVDPHYRRWAQTVAAGFQFMERSYLPLADQIWACSTIDAERFRREFQLPVVHVVPNAVDVGAPPPPATGRNLVYVAQMGYRPNEDAALRLIEMSCRMRARGVEHNLHLVGRPTDAIRRAAEGHAQISVHGVVPDTAPFLAMATVVPVTLRVGGGTRIKIVEAMAAARPVVSTAIGIEGIHARAGEDALICDDEIAFEAAVERLLSDPAEAERIGLNGYQLARQRYSQQAISRLIAEYFRELGLATPPSEERREPPQARVLERSARFNPLTRLLQLRLAVRAAHPLQDAEVELASGDDRALYNSACSIGWSSTSGRPLQWIDVTAVLPPGTTVDDLVVRAYAYGEQVLFASCAGALLVEELGGMLRAEIHADGWLHGQAWKTSASAMPSLIHDRHDVAQIGEPSVLPQRPEISTYSFRVEVGAQFERVNKLVLQSPPPAAESPAKTGGIVDTSEVFWLIEPFKRAHAPSSHRMAAMKDRHAGETAWLIGNGPSVRPEDLDRLQGKLSFAFNRFYLAHGQTAFRPSYTVTGDRQMIDDFGQEIIDRSGGTVFVADEQSPALVGDFIWLRQIALWPPLFSTSPAHWLTPGGSSLFVAMQIAHYMGIRRFYLYGADFKFVYRRERGGDRFRTAVGDDNHFIKNYRNNKPWCPPSFRNICPAFGNARILMERDGGWIRNATRGGLLEIFERADFDAALSADTAQL